MEMGQVHTGLGNTVVLTLLIFSTECPGPVAMFKPKKEERKKKGRGLGGPERENQSTVITAHTSHSFLRHSHSPGPGRRLSLQHLGAVCAELLTAPW